MNFYSTNVENMTMKVLFPNFQFTNTRCIQYTHKCGLKIPMDLIPQSKNYPHLQYIRIYSKWRQFSGFFEGLNLTRQLLYFNKLILEVITRQNVCMIYLLSKVIIFFNTLNSSNVEVHYTACLFKDLTILILIY